MVYESLKKKLILLNRGGYQVCNAYILFMESEVTIEETWLEKMLSKMATIQSEFEKRFQMVYLLSQESLIAFAMEKPAFKLIDIGKQQRDLACLARKLVEDGEELS